MREQTPLLRKTNRREVGLKLKYRRRCCVTSKSALLIMCWNLFITIIIAQWIDTSNYLLIPKLVDKTKIQKVTPAFLSFLAILYFFFPLAGFLADIKCDRYKTVTNSLWLIFWSALFLTIEAYVLALTMSYLSRISVLDHSHHSVSIATIILIAIGVGLPMLSAALLLLISYVGFSANIIQFGMDQLFDSHSEDLAIFIHWFVFTYNIYIGLALSQLMWTTYDIRHNIYVLPIPVILTLVLLGVSLCIARCKRNWFLIDTGSRNPYKLVYMVTKFAAQHRNPICRSAFTYCEDELPSRMDLGKEKYGGPFTTEQVEDVKAFLGILSVLLALGPIFTMEVAVSRMLFIFPVHLKMSFKEQTLLFYLKQYIILGGFPNMFITIFLPVYLCILRHFIHHYIPGMLKRIGLGTLLFLLSSICILLIDVLGHVTSNNQVCFLNISAPTEPQLNVSVWYIILPYTLNAIGYMFLYTAIFEFICAQCPHAMKGLLVGILFTVEGIFQLIGIIILAPFTIWKFEISFPSCGFVYYLVNILVALIGLVAYICISRRYQYRQRDESDNTYRYAEEYYDRDQDSSYDYSNDHDHLNVHSLD